MDYIELIILHFRKCHGLTGLAALFPAPVNQPVLSQGEAMASAEGSLFIN